MMFPCFKAGQVEVANVSKTKKSESQNQMVHLSVSKQHCPFMVLSHTMETKTNV